MTRAKSWRCCVCSWKWFTGTRQGLLHSRLTSRVNGTAAHSTSSGGSRRVSFHLLLHASATTCARVTRSKIHAITLLACFRLQHIHPPTALRSKELANAQCDGPNNCPPVVPPPPRLTPLPCPVPDSACQVEVPSAPPRRPSPRSPLPFPLLSLNLSSPTLSPQKTVST